MRLSLFLTLLWTVGRAATFDIATFTPPAGWKAEPSSDHVAFSHIDQAAGNFCMIGLYNSRPGSGDSLREFAAEWKDIVQKSFTAGPAPRPFAGTTSAGIRFVEGGDAVRWGGNSSWAQLMTFAVGDRVASVLLVATDRRALAAREPATRAFLDSLRFGGGSAALPAPVSPAGPEPTAGGGGVAGVWMGFRAVALGSWEMGPRWYTFFDDGQVFEDIPRTGLLGFDRNASRADPNQQNYWGTWRYENGSGLITKPGSRYTEKIRLESPGVMAIDSEKFSRCASVDGLRLDGTWTSFGDPNDPAIGRLAAGARPVFRFSPDGRFVDEGVFASFLRDSGSDPRSNAGSGTYEIRDFTLTLRYSDGHVQRIGLTGMLRGDPKVQNDVIFIGRARFNKRK